MRVLDKEVTWDAMGWLFLIAILVGTYGFISFVFIKAILESIV